MLNVIFSLLAGMMIWFAGLWSAGGAKLFLGYSFIIPLSIYSWGYVTGFPSLTLLINTFVPVFLYYFFLIMKKTSLKQKSDIMKEMFKLNFLLRNALFVFAFIWIIDLILSQSFMGGYTNVFVVVALLFFFFFLFETLLKLNVFKVSILLSAMHLITSYKDIFTPRFAQYFLMLFVLFILIRHFIINIGHTFFSKDVYIEDLKAGMIPVENIIIRGEEYSKEKIEHTSFLSGLLDNVQNNKIFHQVSDGLTELEIKKLQKLHAYGHFKSHSVRIGHTMAFAHFMFIGAILTIAFKGNIIIALYKILETFI
jgi:hypothetical protein